ncbi:hypothetical protein B0H11DRAFT_2266547 [Mycena galericulata]|nr:hypothetical protein B0H11DRAFT_2266547 [Mycena galericulata]
MRPHVPASSTYTIPRRGQVVPLQQSFVDLLIAEFALLDRQRRNILAGDPKLIVREGRNWSADTGHLVIVHGPVNEDESSASESDSEYSLPHSSYDLSYREYHFRPRPPRIPLADITPVPNVFTGEFMVDRLGFRRVEWEEPRVLADLEDRIGGVFVGPPHQRSIWEQTIREANNIMRNARSHLDFSNLEEADYVRSGITYDRVLKRPRRIDRRYNLNNIVVLAALRNSKAIQDITSFQNAILEGVAPRLWHASREVIDAVVAHDCELHVPFDLGNGHGPYQPTAFSEVEYRFNIADSAPRRDLGDHPPAWRVVTAVGQYPYTEGALILWTHRVVVNFPPGSSFLFPAGLVRYSFAAVEKPGWQMIISQSCSAGLHSYVANNFDDLYARERKFPTRAAEKADRVSRARAAIELYPTVVEWDAAQEET